MVRPRRGSLALASAAGALGITTDGDANLCVSSSESALATLPAPGFDDLTDYVCVFRPVVNQDRRTRRAIMTPPYRGSSVGFLG